jgi:hypothetical protein
VASPLYPGALIPVVFAIAPIVRVLGASSSRLAT